jgi:hypothetical protein
MPCSPGSEAREDLALYAAFASASLSDQGGLLRVRHTARGLFAAGTVGRWDHRARIPLALLGVDGV